MLKLSLRAAAVLLAGAALLGSAPVVRAPAADPVAVVVHPQNPVRTMSFDQLRRVFLAQQQFWPGRARINLLVNAPQQPERAVVLRRIFSMSEDQYRQFWIAKVFRAEVPSAPATAAAATRCAAPCWPPPAPSASSASARWGARCASCASTASTPARPAIPCSSPAPRTTKPPVHVTGGFVLPGAAGAL